jgi:hypothetical protein
MRKSTCLFVTTLAFFLIGREAAAQEPPPPWFEPAPAGTPLPPNITPNPDGTVSVTRTPEQGVDVHATTSAGTVHGYGCNRVDVDPNTRSDTPHGPCPLAHMPPPPPVYMPPPPPRLMYPPVKNPRQAMKPQWAPDPARRNALIASSIVFGLGTMLSGTAYAMSAITSSVCNSWSDTSCFGPSKPALYAMGAFVTVTPSIPRFVVGDYGKAILYTALRGGSFAAGALIDWSDPTYLVPITLTFIAPVTLGIIDLATTPHREQLEAKSANGFQLLGVGPTVATDFRGQSIPALGAIGTF